MSRQPVDPERPRGANAFDQAANYSGQGYTVGRELAEGARAADPVSRPAADARDLPPEAGRRAHVDPATGAVHGSGAGAGGGNPGEDFDSSSSSGDSYPVTGGENPR